ncbi:uncharacterized protein LOC122060621 [Macadamia integrifolia]|uniref:uncharacterized protein LOC122060621 n=1 Tax=Macadamia integrifolia TaxID=60698 RepID=UPI001C530D79|nr:uncharacterized protein LOC122060621 [Macadamia integrifolia]
MASDMEETLPSKSALDTAALIHDGRWTSPLERFSYSIQSLEAISSFLLFPNSPYLNSATNLIFQAISITSTRQLYLQTLIKTSEYVVVAAVTNRYYLAYWKPGADKWTTITFELELWSSFEDVIFYKGLLYAASNHGPIVSYDFSSEPPIGREITGPPPNGRRCNVYYLVESLGELLLVLRHYRWHGDDQEDDDGLIVSPPFPFKTIKFQVHKLKSIGDCILFWGNNCSVSVSAQEYPECKGNSIYYNDDWDYGPDELARYGYHDIGVFNLESHRVESFLESSPSTTPTFWIAPEPVGSVSINFIFKLFNID